MGLKWSNCPACAGPLFATTELVRGAKVIGCSRCKRYMLEGDDKWFAPPFPDGLIATLKARHELMTKDSDETRLHDAWHSDWDDPRWELM